MKIKKYFTIAIIFLLTSLIFGCGDDRASTADVAYGTEGIIVEPTELHSIYYEDDYLNLELFVHNRGMYSNPAGKILVGGFDRNAIKIPADPIDLPEVIGKDPFLPEGGTEMIEVEETGPLVIPLGVYYDPILQISTCYIYQTTASPDICVLGDVEETFVCKPKTQYLNTQGAPVAVTEVTEEAMENHINVIAKIENLGDGTVVTADDVVAFENCPYSLGFNDRDIVKVTMFISNLGDPVCTPSDGYVRLINGEGMITCMFTKRDYTTYTTPVHIVADYAYTETIEEQIEIYARTEKLLPGHPGLGSSQVPYGTLPEQEEMEETGDCYCSPSNVAEWGGCVCLYINGKEHVCSHEEVVTIPASNGKISFEVRGTNDVIGCGDSPEEPSCPTTVTYTADGYYYPTEIMIWGKMATGSKYPHIAEWCTIQAQS